MADLVADVVNQALDAIGADMEIGDIEEGTKAARVALRSYHECLKQLLRAAQWNFATARAPLDLVADATGRSPSNIPTVVPEPWMFEYDYPEDCVKIRMIPGNRLPSVPAPTGNIAIPLTPLMTGLTARPPGMGVIPSRYAIATDSNYPPPTPPGFATGPNRKVILCNVPNADIIYIRRMDRPSEWDPLFRSAFVSYLAQDIVMGVLPDKKLARQMRAEQIGITRQKVIEARVADGNEVPMSSDIPVDWMRARSSGSRRWGGGGSMSGADSGYNHDLWSGEIEGNMGGPFGPAISSLPFADGSSV